MNKSYCYQAVAPVGSELYYSLKKIPSNQQDPIVAVYAFYQDIQEVIFKDTEQSIIHARLNWWRNDILSIPSKQCKHPISACLPVCDATFIQHYLDLIDGLEQNRNPTPFLSFEEVVIHVMRTAGLRDRLIATLLYPNKNIDLDLLYSFSLVTELVHYLQSLRRYLRIGKFYFAATDLQRFSVTAEMFYHYQTTPGIRELLKEMSTKIHSAYKTLSQESSHQYFLTRAKMAMATLQAIQSLDYKVLEQWIQVTPLKLWWVGFI